MTVTCSIIEWTNQKKRKLSYEIGMALPALCTRDIIGILDETFFHIYNPLSFSFSTKFLQCS